MIYNNLLKHPKWKRKRLKILERDKFECQRCGINSKKILKTFGFNLSYTEIKKRGKVKFFSDDDFNVGLVKINIDKIKIICKTPLTKGDFKKNNKYILIYNYVKKDKIKYPFNGSTEKYLVDNTFLEGVNKKAIEKLNIKKKKKRIIDKEGFYFINENQEMEYAKNNSPLHVHHKCYRKDKKIWNQKSKDYITLCNVCHMIVHDSQNIPYYDENGNNIRD